MAALEEGEEILRSPCVSHNYLWFYRRGIEASLVMGDWDRAERYADALEAYTRAEPLPFTDYFIQWGRALAAHGRGRRDDAMTRELRELRSRAEQVQLNSAVALLRDALSDV